MPTGINKIGVNKGRFKKGHGLGIKRPPRSAEWNKRIGDSHRGKKASKETREKWSKQRMGNKYKLGKKESLETRKKKSEARKGNKNPNWRGGVGSINIQIRSSLEYKLWRTAVFERDNYTCVWCGAKNGEGKKIIFNADHIKPFALFPELRFAIDNGRTLCVPCHRTTDTYCGRTKPIPD